MLDVNFIVNHPNEFNLAMQNRGESFKAEPIILAIKIQNIVKKQQQVENRIKKLKAEIYFCSKRGLNVSEKQTNLVNSHFELFDLIIEETDARIERFKYEDSEEAKFYANHGIKLTDYYENEIKIDI